MSHGPCGAAGAGPTCAASKAAPASASTAARTDRAPSAVFMKALTLYFMTRVSFLSALACGVALASAVSLAQRGAAAPPATGPQLLHPMFHDHAVLQRDRPIAVYGETTPAAAVTVSLGDVSAQGRAGSDGQWRATLPAMAAGGPYTLTATANGETRSASDVLVGDVFLCAGQSNMAFAQRQ